MLLTGTGRFEEEDQVAGANNLQVVVSSYNEGMGVSEFATCDDWMGTNDLRNTSILGGISRGMPLWLSLQMARC